jgi:hypothetical protein
MSLILSGTEGVADVDGSAATPAIRGTDANTGIFFPAADTIAFAEGGAEVARFDSAGNFGIGTTSPRNAGAGFQGITLNGSSSGFLDVNTNSTRVFTLFGAGNDIVLGGVANGAMTFQTNGTERARIDSSGNFGVGTTSPTVKLDVSGAIRASSGADQGTQLNAWTTAGGDGSLAAFNLIFNTGGNNARSERARIDSSGNFLVGSTDATYVYAGSSMRWVGTGGGLMLSQNSTANVNQVVFWNPNGTIGSINTSGTTTIFATSSDYRLKENVQPMTGALARIAALKPVTYRWKVDGSDGEGFIAHELQQVVPDAVTGAKDAVDAEGNPQYQGFDASFLVATLTAALQEAHGLITALTARVEALEGAQP